jgi:PAS domain S-box-containing protein
MTLSLYRSRWRFFIISITIIAYCFVGWLLGNIGRNIAHNRLSSELAISLAGTSALLNQTMSKPLILARLVGKDEITRKLIDSPDDPVRRDQAIQLLDRFKAESGSLRMAIYSGKGILIATERENSKHIGKDLSFRPFVREALSGRESHYYAYGVTDKIRGYYASVPIFNGSGNVIGAAMAKYELEEKGLNIDKHEHMYLISPDGVVFLSSNPEWLLKSLYPIDQNRRKRLLDSEQFGKIPFEHLSIQWNRNRREVSFNNKTFLFEERPVTDGGWKLVMFIQNTLITGYLWMMMGLTFCLFVVTAGGILFFVKQKQNKIVLEQYNLNLEKKVSERTKELSAVNRSLEEEVNERKKKEAELKKSHALLESIMEGTTDAIFVKNLAGQYIMANTSTCEAFGRQLTEVIGKNDSQLFQTQSEQVIKEIDTNVIRSGKTSLSEERLTTAYGDTYWLSNKSPYRDQNGQIIGLIGISRDITELKKAEQEKQKLQNLLKQAQKMEAIGTLAGGIAHDFNNILGVILGCADLALIEAQPNSQYAKDLEKISAAGNRAKDLVQQILAFSRQVEIERIPITLQSLIKEALKILRPSIPTTIEIQDDIDPQCGVVLADPTQVHQIVMNLCTNANHAMEESGGVLTIKLQPVCIKEKNPMPLLNLSPGDYVKLTVSDTGTGIDLDIIDKIFDPYFTTKELSKGTGMGLAIIHGIVTEYGGTITVDSELGKGSSFHVYFPVVEKNEVLFTQNTEDIPHGKGHILFVDDEELLVELGQKMLERLGYKVTVRCSSPDALSTFQNSPDGFDVIITDQTMPEMTGSDLARRILQIRPDTPIILCTGYSNVVDKETAESIGIRKFVLKPLTMNKIAQLLHEVLHGKGGEN